MYKAHTNVKHVQL